MSRRKPATTKWKAKQKHSKTRNKNRKVENDNNDESKLEEWMIHNLEQQKTEFASIIDIYANEITVIKQHISYQFIITNEDNKWQQIILNIQYPIQYPSKSAPTYSISSSYLKQIPNRIQIEHKLQTIYNENGGECIVFEWISEFQEFASIIFESDDTAKNSKNVKYVHCCLPVKEQRHKLRMCPDIIFCDKSIEDRKSLFKSYAASVTDIDQITAFIDKLKSNKKIAKATHNMIAYRLSSLSAGILNEDYDDDGEHGGGKVILQILRKRKICDVVVMVTRWYGGIHLSSDRFKHIKNMTQYVLQQCDANKTENAAQSLRKPMGKNIEIGTQICNRLYWNQNKEEMFERNGVLLGCKCLNDIIEFNLDEYGVQKKGIKWVEYVTYKGLLVWDIFHLCRNFEELYQIIQTM